MRRTGAVFVVVAALGVVVVTAQQTKPRFEVASVKPQPEPLSFQNMATAGMRVRPGGVFTSSHASLMSLIWFAYDLRTFEVAGAPDWARRELFDISARAGSDVPEAQVKLMVRSLLEDRFKLVAHSEKRELPFVAIVLARPDGQLGPYIRRLEDDCTIATASEVKKQFPPRPEMKGGGTARGACQPLSSMADGLTLLPPQETVYLDKTGLSGKFVWELRAASLSLTPDPASNADPNLPPFREALADQLGLKLESRRGPIDVLVIDSVQRPTEN